MTAAWSDWAEERKFRVDAVKGSRRLLRAIQKAQHKAAPKPRRAPKPRPKLTGTVRPHDGVSRIQNAVAAYFGLPAMDLWADTRKRQFARPRQVTMFLAHERGISLPRIGQHFGKDHTTVLHACRVIASNDKLGADVAALRERLAA